MTVPLGFKQVIDLDGQQWLIEGTKVISIESLADVSGPKVVLSDFGHALTGMETVHSGKSYAPAIIEKQLRDHGDMEGASEVLVLSSRKTASALDVFYAAIPIQKYSDYLNSIKSQNDHCLYVPIWSAMLRTAQKDVTSIVFQHGEVLDVIVVQDGFPLHSIRVSSSSYGGQDWDSALNYLATELNQVEADKKIKVNSIKWFAWCGDQTLNELASRFESLSSRNVSIGKKKSIEINGESCDSNIAELFNKLSSQDAIKSDSGKTLYNFERVLPWVAGVALAISAGAFMAGLNWQKSAQDYMDSAQALLASSQFEEKLVKVKELVSKNNQSSSVIAADKVAFIDELHSIANSQSIPQIIGDIQAVVNQHIHINKIQLNSLENDETFGMILDGHIDQDLDFAAQQVDQLIARLIAKGYQIEDKGFVAKNGNNGFQLILIPGNKE